MEGRVLCTQETGERHLGYPCVLDAGHSGEHVSCNGEYRWGTTLTGCPCGASTTECPYKVLKNCPNRDEVYDR